MRIKPCLIRKPEKTACCLDNRLDYVNRDFIRAFYFDFQLHWIEYA